MPAKKTEEPDLVVHACNPSTWEDDAGGLGVEGENIKNNIQWRKKIKYLQVYVLFRVSLAVVDIVSVIGRFLWLQYLR